MGKKKKVAVLTSGGDSPGMNAAIRGVVRAAIYFGFDVYGVKRGYQGILDGDFVKMNLRSVSNIISRGGTILHTSRSTEFNTPEGVKKAAEICKEKGFSGVVCLGGDGTFRGALDLSREGITCVGIPCTIDNDIACTEYTIGFDTAISTAMELTDKIRDTTESHDRCSVVEVMGRKCGDIAIETALSVGALAVLVPEVPFDIQKDVVDRMMKAYANGKQHFLIVAAEGVGDSQKIAEEIEKRSGLETRATVLGYVQRGGSPTQRDRAIAGIMGYRAAECIRNDDGSRIIALRNGEVTDFEMEEALSMKRVFDADKYKIARRLSI